MRKQFLLPPCEIVTLKMFEPDVARRFLLPLCSEINKNYVKKLRRRLAYRQMIVLDQN